MSKNQSSSSNCFCSCCPKLARSTAPECMRDSTPPRLQYSPPAAFATFHDYKLNNYLASSTPLPHGENYRIALMSQNPCIDIFLYGMKVKNENNLFSDTRFSVPIKFPYRLLAGKTAYHKYFESRTVPCTLFRF